MWLLMAKAIGTFWMLLFWLTMLIRAIRGEEVSTLYIRICCLLLTLLLLIFGVFD